MCVFIRIVFCIKQKNRFTKSKYVNELRFVDKAIETEYMKKNCIMRSPFVPNFLSFAFVLVVYSQFAVASFCQTLHAT